MIKSKTEASYEVPIAIGLLRDGVEDGQADEDEDEGGGGHSLSLFLSRFLSLFLSFLLLQSRKSRQM